LFLRLVAAFKIDAHMVRGKLLLEDIKLVNSFAIHIPGHLPLYPLWNFSPSSFDPSSRLWWWSYGSWI